MVLHLHEEEASSCRPRYGNVRKGRGQVEGTFLAESDNLCCDFPKKKKYCIDSSDKKSQQLRACGRRVKAGRELGWLQDLADGCGERHGTSRLTVG